MTFTSIGLPILVAVVALLLFSIAFVVIKSRTQTQSKELDLKHYLMPTFHKHGFIQNDTNPDLMEYKGLYSIDASKFPVIILSADFGDGMEQAGQPIPIVGDGATPEETALALDAFLEGLVSVHQEENE
ncbi:hypothetical protein [Vibrio mediterranei]|uniref:hypothetical protein n=1 Tax=Vibrio mediterranei TaxID=689 RepID=UPI002283648F|nr:hypothetical protein [Vibrio mediterranei]MCY9853997.1 hypothetical protein [Vibrio mediterranei]